MKYVVKFGYTDGCTLLSEDAFDDLYPVYKYLLREVAHDDAICNYKVLRVQDDGISDVVMSDEFTR